MQDIVLAEWQKGNGNIIRFKVYELDGHLRLDLREYFPVDGEWKPTRRGINLPARAANEISKSAKRAGRLVESRATKKRRSRKS
jgi:hypothetical protein